LGIPCYLGELYQTHIKDAPNITWIKDCHHHLINFDNPDVLDEWHLPQLCSFGGSVNVATQVATKLGFDDIILLGCDLLYRNGKGKSHFHKDYETGEEMSAFYASHNALWGHITALNYIRRKMKNVRVRNATRGGMLEIWERVTLDEVCQ